MKIRKPITSTPTPTTLFLPLDHHHHQETKSDNIQENDPAAEISSSEDVDTPLSLASVHADRHEAVTMINLAETFRNDIDFLDLGSTADCSRNHKNDGPLDDRNEIDFLGVGIATSSDHEINRGRRVTVLNPTPLRSYHPSYGYMYYYSTDHHNQDKASSNTSCAKRKREQKNNTNNVNVKKGGKRSKVDEYPNPINPPQELVRRIGPMTTRPVFLYRKQLVKWDTMKHQNRLFVYNAEKLMSFLTEEESRAVGDNKVGVDVFASDGMGREYKLQLTRWSNKPVLKKDWNKIVEDNRAEIGDWVHLWAYRRGEADEFCLYVDFREQP